jgi:hypothetical protein
MKFNHKNIILYYIRFDVNEKYYILSCLNLHIYKIKMFLNYKMKHFQRLIEIAFSIKLGKSCKRKSTLITLIIIISKKS